MTLKAITMACFVATGLLMGPAAFAVTYKQMSTHSDVERKWCDGKTLVGVDGKRYPANFSVRQSSPLGEAKDTGSCVFYVRIN